MSGHSKWSTIKRAKGAADAKRGALFAKLSKKISIAVREGGSGDPANNFRLRVEIEKARAVSMPNDNIERAIKKGLGQDGSAIIEEVTYEGYGPYGTAFIIETATDNRNRTVSNIKHILSKHDGTLGAQGSVSWQFTTRGQIMIIRDNRDLPELGLAAIDRGAEDIAESEEGLIIYTKPQDLDKIKNWLIESGVEVAEAEIVKESEQQIELSNGQWTVIEKLIQELEDNEDVTAVYTSAK